MPAPAPAAPTAAAGWRRHRRPRRHRSRRLPESAIRPVRRARTAAGALALLLAVLGCERPAEEPVRSAPPEEPPVILFVGTSLTAGYGVLPQDAFPALIEARLRETGAPHRVVAAGRSGETSAEALARMDRVLARRVDVLVLESGANDLLRGMDPDRTRRNLQAMVDAARRRTPGWRSSSSASPPRRAGHAAGPALRPHLSGAGSAQRPGGGALAPGGRGRSSRAQPGGRDPPERRRTPPHGRHRLGGAA
jgi:hypothetical protein